MSLRRRNVASTAALLNNPANPILAAIPEVTAIPLRLCPFGLAFAITKCSSEPVQAKWRSISSEELSMRVFVAGSGGAIGKALIPLLVNTGHIVTALTRSESKSYQIRSLGANPVVADALDKNALLDAVRRARPEAVIHQLTAIPPRVNIKKFDDEFTLTNKLRTLATDYLIEAAREAGATRFIAQSFAGWNYARTDGTIKTEDDPLDPHPPEMQRRTLDAIRRLEKAVLDVKDLHGVALRYGVFYGPETSISANGYIVEEVKHRRFPIIGRGTGVWSFIHIEDAASATVAALRYGSPGIYNIVDDDPAPVSEWLPYLAAAVGAKPPLRVPTFIGRLVVGEVGVSFMTQVRGASNAKAGRELLWRPKWRSWRDGFRRGLCS